MGTELSDEQLRSWAADGYLHVAGFLEPGEVQALAGTVDTVARRRDGDGGLMQHYELGDDDEVRICRSERLVEGSDLVRALLTSGRLPAMAAELLGEPMLLYKEKINYKLPGGAGFAPHQDAPAYPFVDTHLTGMLAVDDATVDNGCLELTPGLHGGLLPTDDAGCIRADVAAQLAWRPLEMAAGDLLWFHSLAPHRSAGNRSALARRALFCTYNAASAGDLREAYYDEKARRFAVDDERATTRVSLIGDFQGRAPGVDRVRAYQGRLDGPGDRP